MHIRIQMIFGCVYVMLIASRVKICCIGSDERATKGNVDPKETEWLDPGNMLDTDLSTFKTGDHENEKQSKSKASKENSKNHDFVEESPGETVLTPQSTCEMPYFKQLTRIIMESFERPGKHYARIELSENDLKTLNEFRNRAVDGERIQDVLEVVSGIFSRVQGDERETYSTWYLIQMTLEYNKEIFAVLAIIFTLLLVLLMFETQTSMSWYQQFWYLLAGLFIVSIPWEWFRLYRKEFAKKQSEMIKQFPRHCIPNNMTILQSMSLWMSNLLKWKEDECAKYQEAILVDPVWEVSPSQAFSITATRFLVKPLEYIAEALGRSFSAFFMHVPGQWQPFMFLGIVVTLLLCLLLCTKSRIKFGFFEIGPATQPLTRLQNEDITSLLKAVEKIIRKEIEPIRKRRPEIPRNEAVVHDEKLDVEVNHCVRETHSPRFDIPIVEEIPK